MTAPTVISTFSGPGGSSLGYERAGFDVRAALDCAPGDFSNEIPKTYRANHPDTAFLEQDARTTGEDELLDAANLDVGEVDILDGSPPCSPFSTSNSVVKWGDHKDGTLFDRYAYFVKEIQPKAFVAENVPGLATGGTKGYYKVLCKNLRDAGYNLQVRNIDAAYLGGAHHRRRLIFIGVREDIGEPPVIKPNKKPTTVREAWASLHDHGDVDEPRRRAERSDVFEYIQDLPPDASTSTADLRDDGKESRFTQYRLSYRKPSPTLTSSYHDFIHPAEDRHLTIPEVKRLIGLPDDYILPDSYGHAWECAIRCLPPILNQTVGEAIRDKVL